MVAMTVYVHVTAVVSRLAGNGSLCTVAVEPVLPVPHAPPDLVHDHVVLAFVLPVHDAPMPITPPVEGRLALPAVKLTEQPVGDAGGVKLQFNVVLA